MKKRKIVIRDKKGHRKDFFFDTLEIAKQTPKKEKPKSKKIYNCDSCPLDKDNFVQGDGSEQGQFLWLGRDPGKDEVKKGVPFVGKSGMFLRDIVDQYRPRPFRQMIYIDNIVSCRPPGNKFSSVACKCCYDRVEELIERIKPKIIVTIGKEATERILGDCNSIEAFRGFAIPSPKYNCIVTPIYHPAYVLRADQYRDLEGPITRVFEKDIENIFKTWALVENDPSALSRFLKERAIHYMIKEITSVEQMRNLVDEIYKLGRFSIDFEGNTAKVYTAGSQLYIASIAIKYVLPNNNKKTGGYWVRLHESDPRYTIWTEEEATEIENLIAQICTDPSLTKIIQNSKHEDHCLRQFFGVKLVEPIVCTMVRRHILHSRSRITSLQNQAMIEFGAAYKYKTDPKLQVRKGERFNRISELEPTDLGERCALDSIYTLNLYDRQLDHIDYDYRDNNRINNCIEFFMKGIKVFTEMEHRGINIDIPLLLELRKKYRSLSFETENKIGQLAVVKRYSENTDKPLNLNSFPQLRTLLFSKEYYNLKPIKTTAKTQAASVDAETLNLLAKKNKFCKLLLEKRKMDNLVSTYLDNIERFVGEDGRLHPDFWLHLASSYRSSSSHPNFQNFPKRYDIGEDLHAKEIRKVFIPTADDWELLEVDYSGNEVKALAMLSQDQNLIEDLNAGLDMHKYWAAHLNEILESEVTPTWRSDVKNGFVFPSLYGASYYSIYQDLCERAEFSNARRGEQWVKTAQDLLYERYKRVRQWQFEQFQFYRTYNYVETATEFRREGPLEWNKIINSSIQGTAFHLLLAACIDIEDAIERLGLKAKFCGQIHDSAFFDAPIKERRGLIQLVNNIMLNPKFEWAKGVKIEVEWQVGRNWGEMKDLNI